MTRLDAMPMPTVIEDVLRHPTVWKRIAERLHPFEHAARYPRASLIFTVLRDARHHVGTPAGLAVLNGAREGWIRVVDEVRNDGRYVGARVLSLPSVVEGHLAHGDVQAALDALRDRPGDLLRRLDQLARLWAGDADDLVDAARAAAATASPKVVLAALASLVDRDQVVPRAQRVTVTAATGEMHASRRGRRPWRRERTVPEDRRAVSDDASADDPRAPRVFFPKGGASFVWSASDRRPLLRTGLPEALRGALTDALVERARPLATFDLAIVDIALRDVPVPAGTQSASGASRALPRGTVFRHPETETLRLFLHWVQPDRTRVDLDLSALFFDEQWRRLDHCDYTRLSSQLGAIHSGDLTSAPAPLGATEFLDLDVASLRANGVTWVVPVVFSYNDVPFENLDAAIAGVGVPTDGRHFDPAGVLVRYDLVGDSRSSIPFAGNLVDGTLRWLDQHLPSRGYAHSVGTRGDALAHTVADLESLYAGATRPTAYELTMIHARARASLTLLWDGERFLDVRGNAVAAPPLQGRRVFVACVSDPPDVTDADDGSLVYSILRGGEGKNRPLTDMLDQLT